MPEYQWSVILNNVKGWDKFNYKLQHPNSIMEKLRAKKRTFVDGTHQPHPYCLLILISQT